MKKTQSAILATALLITSSAYSQIYVTSGDGSIIAVSDSGTKSTFATGGIATQGLAMDAAHNLYSGNFFRDSVYKTTPAGVTTTFATGLYTPTAIGVDQIGNVYVTSYFGNTIYKFDSSGTLLNDSFGNGSGHQAIGAIAIDRDGNVFASNGGGTTSINRFTPDGTGGAFVTVDYNVSGLAFDSANNLYASSQGGDIFKYDQNGTKSTFATGITGGGGLAFDDGFLFATGNTENGNIYKIAPDGATTVFASGLNYPSAIAVPEPTTVALFGSGSILLALQAFRRK